ncbi:MAG: hypothetical protein RMJ56_06715 [Gemmataceae bacterium]|nr:hypothetical protein [Gemmata sp.]MDW8197281.1 hypothetical protein [Gemmataceae bacterium]
MKLEPFLEKATTWVVRLGVVVAAAVIGAWLQWWSQEPITLVIPEASPPNEYTPTFGWHPDAEAIALNRDRTRTLHFDATPAGQAVLGETEVFLWRHVRKAAGYDATANWYPSINQQNVGCCVGCGWKHCADVCQATAIASGHAFTWQPVSAEVIYGGSRVDVGGGRLSGDGSVGAWAKEYVSSRGGIVPMQKFTSADLSHFSPARARAFGYRGIPPDIAAFARRHPVQSCALVTRWRDAKRAIQQGYPVAICSNQGFSLERDDTGRCRPQGVWYHCLALIAIRTTPHEGGFLLNSWGETAHRGPLWPPDMPPAGFWADAAILDGMLQQGDSFALADVAGFPQRRLDWFVHQPHRLPHHHPLVAPLPLAAGFHRFTFPHQEVLGSW